MKTRRSPRNQERLWKELGGKPVEPQSVAPKTVEEIKAMFWLGKTSRNALLREAAGRARNAALKEVGRI